jgi:septum formation protein
MEKHVNPRLILASASPRRREILARLNVPFDIIPSDADETVSDDEGPDGIVRELSARKAAAVLGTLPDGQKAVVAAADTIVWLDHKLGKPRDRADAVAMISSLSGQTHGVYTGFTVTDGLRTVTDYDVTYVTFRALSTEEIAAYADTDEPYDKAGAYAIQGGAAKFVTKVDGDYDNVVGFPLNHIRWVLSADFGFRFENVQL